MFNTISAIFTFFNAKKSISHTVQSNFRKLLYRQLFDKENSNDVHRCAAILLADAHHKEDGISHADLFLFGEVITKYCNKDAISTLKRCADNKRDSRFTVLMCRWKATEIDITSGHPDK